jgi:hypothetical protein
MDPKDFDFDFFLEIEKKTILLQKGYLQTG